MPLFYNDQQAGIPWQGLPPLSRPSPQGQSQAYSGIPAPANMPVMQGPVAPPMGGPQSNMRRADKPFWSGLPRMGAPYGR